MKSLTQNINDALTRKYSNIHIGEYTRIWGSIDDKHPHVKIGFCTVLGGGSTILTHCPVIGIDNINMETIIGHDTWIGHRCIILPNIKIGNRVLIGAGSVVTKDIPDDMVYAGNPAKFIRIRDAIEIVRTHLTTKQGLSSGKPGVNPNWKLLSLEEMYKIFDSKERGDLIYKKLLDLKYI